MALSRKSKAILISAGILLALLVAAALALPGFLDIDQHRPRIQAALSDAMQEDVVIGRLDLRLLPFVVIRADGLKVTERKSRQVLLEVESLEASPRLWPLLRRRAEIRSVTLVRPVALVEFDAEGKPKILKKLDSLMQEEGEGAPAEKPAIEEVVLESLRMEGATARLRQKEGLYGLGKAIDMEDLNLRLDGLDGNGPMRVESEGILKPQGARWSASGTLGPLPGGESGPDGDLTLSLNVPDLAAFKALWKESEIPVTGGAAKIDGTLRKKGGGIFWEGSAAVTGLKPQNAELRAEGSFRYGPAGVEVPGVHVSVQSFEMGGMPGFWKSLGLPEMAGRASVDTDISGKPSEWAMKGIFKGDFQKPKVLSVDMDYDFALADGGESLRVKKLELNTQAADLSASGTVQNLSTEPRFDLRAQLRRSRLEEIAALMELGAMGGADFSTLRGQAEGDMKIRGTQKAPELEGTLQIRDVSMKTDTFTVPVQMPAAKAVFQKDSVTLDPVSVVLDANRFDGRLRVQGFDAPSLDFAFTSPKLDIGNLFQLLPEEDPQAAKTRKTEGPRDLPSDDPLRKVVMKGSLETPLAVYDKVQCRDVKASVRMRGAVLTVEPLSFTLYGGRTTHGFEVDMAPAEPAFRLDSRLEGVDMNALLADGADLKDTLYGKLFMNCNLSGQGFEEGEMGKRLAGGAHFELRDGYLNTVNYLKKIQVAAGLVGIRKGLDEGSTRFHRFDGDIDIGKSRFRTENSRMVSEDLDIRIKGNMDFDLKLDLYATTYLSKELTAQIKDSREKNFFLSDDGRATLPAHISGTLEDPHVRPDMEAILKKAGKKYLEEKIGKKIIEGIKKWK